MWQKLAKQQQRWRAEEKTAMRRCLVHTRKTKYCQHRLVRWKREAGERVTRYNTPGHPPNPTYTEVRQASKAIKQILWVNKLVDG